MPDYASVKDIEDVRKKANRHSTIPEITSSYTENVVMRVTNKDTPRIARSAELTNLGFVHERDLYALNCSPYSRRNSRLNKTIYLLKIDGSIISVKLLQSYSRSRAHRGALPLKGLMK